MTKFIISIFLLLSITISNNLNPDYFFTYEELYKAQNNSPYNIEPLEYMHSYFSIKKVFERCQKNKYQTITITR